MPRPDILKYLACGALIPSRAVARPGDESPGDKLPPRERGSRRQGRPAARLYPDPSESLIHQEGAL